jgi:thiol-disulfide isomerase/thioredoxin
VPQLQSTVRQPLAVLFSLACLSVACLLTTGCQRQSNATAMVPAALGETDAGSPALRAEAALKNGTGSEQRPASPERNGIGEVPVPIFQRAVRTEAVDSPAEGSAVELQLLDYAGIEELIASHRGKVVVMDAWAMSCPPCVAEFPKLVALSHQFGKDQLGCISLSFDYEGIGQPTDKLPRVAAFLENQKATFDNVLASEESDTLYRKFHLSSVPAVFVYDKTGALRHRFDNQKAMTAAEHFTYEDVERLVEQLVAEPAPAHSDGPTP